VYLTPEDAVAKFEAREQAGAGVGAGAGAGDNQAHPNQVEVSNLLLVVPAARQHTQVIGLSANQHKY
jgi:hypothetical protein